MKTNVEIQVGEYCRTFDGDIFKVANFYKKGNIYTMVDERGVLFGNPRKVAKKHSFNIIDLIKEGDYVNGERVVDIGAVWKENLESVTYLESTEKAEIFKEDIQTIVTKEQFKSMEYKVGEEDECS